MKCDVKEDGDLAVLPFLITPARKISDFLKSPKGVADLLV